MDIQQRMAMDALKNRSLNDHLYRGVNLQPESLKFFIDSLGFYQRLLENDQQAIKEDPDLSNLLGEDELGSFQLSQELRYVHHILKALKEAFDKNKKNAIFGELDLYHGWVRIIKSAGALYLKHLEERRNSFARKKSKTSHVYLQAMDTRLAGLSEKLQLGVFRDAEPWPILIEDIPEANESILIEDIPEPKEAPLAPKIASSIEILDQQLRARCLDLFNKFSEEDQAHRFDTVISEATRILEDRIRRLSKADPNLDGADLTRFAFNPKEPQLRLGQTPAELEAAHVLFRGVFGLIRNPFHHRLIEKVEKERVVQILGLIDYLLYLTEVAAAETAHYSTKSIPETVRNPQ